MAPRNTEEIHRRALPPRGWHLPLRSRWHGRHARGCALAIRLTRCRLSDRRSQSQFCPDLGLKLGIHFFVIFQELARILTALADALTLVAEPGPGFFQQIVIDRQIEQVAFFGNPFAVHDVEFRFAKRGCNFIFDYFTLVREPVTTSPSLMAAMRRIST